MTPRLGQILYLLRKGSSRRLNAYMTQKEIDCKCTNYSCKRTLLAKSTEESFLNTRVDFGKAIYINSAYRCDQHNRAIKGADDSRHKLGLALDLRPEHSVDLDYLEEVARQHFEVVLRYTSFIHCHNNPKDI